MADKTILVRLIADASQYQAVMGASAATTETFSRQVQTSTARAATSVSGFGKVAGTVGKVTTIGVAAGLALSAKAAIDFQSSFAGVRKTVDATEPQFRRLADSIIDLSTRIPINANELNRIAELGGQLGVQVGSITSFTDTIAKLGITTVLSTEQAALGLARLDNILGLNQTSFDRMGSAIVELGNNFASTEDEILTFSLRIAPVGRTVGLTADEVLALGTAFSSVGVPAERGGTAVQRTLIAIADAAKTGGIELEVFAQVAGVSIADFAELVGTDMSEAFELFVVGLGQIEKRGGNTFQVLRDLGLGSVRTSQSLLAMSNASQVLVRALDASEAAYEVNIALTEEAEKRFETVASRVELAKNQFNALRIEIGQNLLPVMGNLADSFGDFLFGIRELDPRLKSVIGGVLGLVAGLSIASTTTKILARVVGIELTGALAAATFSAILLRAAIGGIILIAAGILISKIIDFGQAQHDAALRTQSLVEALDQETAGFEKATVAAVKNQLVTEGHLTLLNRMGLGLDVFARAIVGESDALEKVTGQIDKRREATEKLRLASQELTQVEGTGSQFIEFDETQEKKFVDASRDVGSALALLSQRTDEYSEAVGTQQARLTEANQSDLIDTFGAGYRNISVAALEAHLATRRLSTTTEEELLPVFEETEKQAIDAGKAVDVFADIINDAFDDIDERIRGNISPLEEWAGAAEINFEKVRLAFIAQVEAAERFAAFREIISELGFTEGVRILDEEDLATQAGFAEAWFEGNRAMVVALLREWQAGSKGISEIVQKVWAFELPGIIDQGTAATLAKLAELVDGLGLEGEEAAIAWGDGFLLAVQEGGAMFGPEFVTEMLGAIGSEELLAAMFGVGIEVVRSILAGINEELGRQDSGLGVIPDTIIQKSAQGWEFGSPSKVMVEMGENVSKSFIMGMRDGLRDFSLDSVGMNVGGSRANPVPGGVTNNTNTRGDINVNVNSPQTQDLAGDIQSGLIYGSILEQMEAL